jgi:hypothetical protein
MIHAPGIGIGDAMKPSSSRAIAGAQNFQVVGYRQIRNLAQASANPTCPATRSPRASATRSTEERSTRFFALLTPSTASPTTARGTTYESHRVLTYVFSIGAADGKLDGLHPILGFVASSWRPDPNWGPFPADLPGALAALQQYIAQGYAQIAAAGRLSRAISANNDMMLRRWSAAAGRQHRQQGGRRQRRLRPVHPGTERMEDPYWDVRHSYNNQYHWTDGQGYQHSTIRPSTRTSDQPELAADEAGESRAAPLRRSPRGQDSRITSSCRPLGRAPEHPRRRRSGTSPPPGSRRSAPGGLEPALAEFLLVSFSASVIPSEDGDHVARRKRDGGFSIRGFREGARRDAPGAERSTAPERDGDRRRPNAARKRNGGFCPALEGERPQLVVDSPEESHEASARSGEELAVHVRRDGSSRRGSRMPKPQRRLRARDQERRRILFPTSPTAIPSRRSPRRTKS